MWKTERMAEYIEVEKVFISSSTYDKSQNAKCYDTCIRRMFCCVGRLRRGNVGVDEEALTRMSDETIASSEK